MIRITVRIQEFFKSHIRGIGLDGGDLLWKDWPDMGGDYCHKATRWLPDSWLGRNVVALILNIISICFKRLGGNYKKTLSAISDPQWISGPISWFGAVWTAPIWCVLTLTLTLGWRGLVAMQLMRTLVQTYNNTWCTSCDYQCIICTTSSHACTAFYSWVCTLIASGTHIFGRGTVRCCG